MSGPPALYTGVVNDPSARASHQLDVVAFGFHEDQGQERLIAIGAVRWGEIMGLAHLERLRRVRDLLSVQGRRGAPTARPTCFSAAGFSAQLAMAAAESPDIILVVHHTPSPTMQVMLEAVLAGARDDAIEGVDVVVRPALAATAVDVLAADV
ncbi:hypothetical protein [Parafrankia sp. FMc2]|uniref:hypothetical protein n=1 Tax=Parafrankia sp. FMc2 TaxID=3233196 RepID=UPI0034D3BF45